VSEPTVCCVCLTRDRAEMLKQAVACFEAQTYANKRMVIIDGCENWRHRSWGAADDSAPIIIHSAPALGLRDDLTIGQLRQIGNLAAQRIQAEIIAHMDDDDWSHPGRLAEQVALLQSSGAECVGYSDLLFWREPAMCPHAGVVSQKECPYCGQAWLYTGGNPAHCPGTTMMYWRKTWEARPFEALPSPEKPWLAEDQVWQRGVKLETVSAMGALSFATAAIDVTQSGLFGGPADTHRRFIPGPTTASTISGDPRMIARIHGGNTSKAYDPELMRASEAQGGQWKRVPSFDSYCREVFSK
jgi:hypothetical protein